MYGGKNFSSIQFTILRPLIMSLITCSKCKRTIDLSNYTEVTNHNQVCGVMGRLSTLQSLIAHEDKEEMIIEEKLKANRKKLKLSHIEQPDVSPANLKSRGTYSTSILSGIPNSTYSTSFRSVSKNSKSQPVYLCKPHHSKLNHSSALTKNGNETCTLLDDGYEIAANFQSRDVLESVNVFT